jgi:3-deoxy-7-phosphoheptulonate synthase
MSTTELSVPKEQPLITPDALLQALPAPAQTLTKISTARHAVKQIINGDDSRLLVVVGPCSIHDPKAALEYAHLLKEAAKKFADELFIVMRVYFEKPRTTIGWKGLISDPFLDGSFNINQGLKLARQLLLDLTDLEIPAGTEFLDTMTSHYLHDLISWGAIGARTSESQIHRELASSLAMPIGFKNTTDGNFKIAIDAVKVAKHPHYFLSMNSQGIPSVRNTSGNDACHIILRGSQTFPNYHAEYVALAASALREANLKDRLIVDCSHGNSMKNYLQQRLVIDSIIEQLKQDSHTICGVMIESNLVAGKQTLQPNQPLKYGQSITDACLAWEDTLPLLEKLAQAKKH